MAKGVYFNNLFRKYHFPVRRIPRKDQTACQYILMSTLHISDTNDQQVRYPNEKTLRLHIGTLYRGNDTSSFPRRNRVIDSTIHYVAIAILELTPITSKYT
jgi:hypothetical protein